MEVTQYVMCYMYILYDGNFLCGEMVAVNLLPQLLNHQSLLVALAYGCCYASADSAEW